MHVFSLYITNGRGYGLKWKFWKKDWLYLLVLETTLFEEKSFENLSYLWPDKGATSKVQSTDRYSSLP